MSTQETVLCPVDRSGLSRRALALAIETCRRTGSRLLIEHNLGGCPPASLGVGWMWSEEHESAVTDDETRAVRFLESLFEDVPGDVDYDGVVSRGAIDETILQLARSVPASLIVMGTHGPSSMRHASHTERVITHAPCAVLTISEHNDSDQVFADADAEASTHVIVPCDFTGRSMDCSEFALSLARHIGHRIEFLHVVQTGVAMSPSPDMAFDLRVAHDVSTPQARLESMIPATLRARARAHVVVGRPADEIVQRARELGAAFIVMPAHGRNRLNRFIFGSTTMDVLHASPCPVWFVSDDASHRPLAWAVA